MSAKKPPILSILIPTRNRCEYLKFAIQSALNIQSDGIEILVSENHSNDASARICSAFSDPRLTIYRPKAALPMHENWEFLLEKARGEWVTYIGDDDAVMPHCVEHLNYLGNKYPKAEAIVSPRAYYYWKGCESEYGDTAVAFDIRGEEVWRDSKRQLKECLEGKVNYLSLPQMYSGGFHRRSLIHRVLRAQGGAYFKSAAPDAYSAVMACIYTFRYLEVGVPLTWVGSSPHLGIRGGKDSKKDKIGDFQGMLSPNTLTINECLGDLTKYTFTLFFFEALLSAFPVNPYTDLSVDKVRQMYLEAVRQYRQRGDEDAVAKLAIDLGFEIPPLPVEGKDREGVIARFYRRARSGLARKLRGLVTQLKDAPMKETLEKRSDTGFRYHSRSHVDHPDILSCDSIIHDAYKRWKAQSRDSDLAPRFPV